MNNTTYNTAPFIIGITGHHDIQPEDIEALRTSFNNLLDQLAKLIPNTQIRVISSMADGADRIAASVAIERGILVEAVFPLTWKDYQHDFSDVSRQEVQTMLKTDGVRVRELSPLEGTRDDAYVGLSDFLCRNSNLLVAFWDGRVITKKGGTSDTVHRFIGMQLKVEEDCPVNLIKSDGSEDSRRFIFWIPSRRISSADEHMVESNPQWITDCHRPRHLTTWRNMPSIFRDQACEQDGFNRAVEVLKKKLPASDRLRESLAPEVIGDDESSNAWLDRAYQGANSLAMYFQRRSDSLFKSFSFMAAAMGFCFLYYAKIDTNKTLLIGYLVLFVAGIFLFRIGRKNSWFSRHLVYRAVAETLRIRFYLNLWGIDGREFVESATSTGIGRIKVLGWIPNVLRGIEALASPISEKSTKDEESRCVIKERWIDDQAAYFKVKGERFERHRHRLELWKTILLVLTITGIVALIFFKKKLAGTDLGVIDLKNLLIFLIGLLPFCLGVWEVHQNKMATRELLWQYHKQADLFNTAGKVLKLSNKHDRVDEVVISLAKQSIQEAILWVVQRYHREYEPPSAG
jgi:hypothetical protein